MGARDLNSGPSACLASTLPNEPSPGADECLTL